MSSRVFPFVIGILFGGSFGSTGAWILWGKAGLGWSFLCIAGVVAVVAFSFAVAASIEGDEDSTGEIKGVWPWPRPAEPAERPSPSTPPDPFEDE